VLTARGWRRIEVAVAGGRIVSERAAGSATLDVDGLRIVPGFIDLQVNGGWGYDLQREPAALWELASCLVEIGVTTFCPTLTTDGHRRRREALVAWRNGPTDPARFVGADPIGWHLEGPWLAPSRHGAHNRGLLQPVPRMVPGDYRPEQGVRIVTLAPELAGALSVITELARRGVVVSCGHSEADSAQARDAFEAGATMGTHLYNAMSGLEHRDTGLAAALLLEESAYLGLIVDGVHVDPEMVDLAWRLARGRVSLISDAVAALGIDPRPPDGVVRLADGTLAGSCTGLDAAVANLVTFTDCDLADAVEAATEVPARCLGLRDRGRIEAGRRADLVVLDPGGQVVLTVAGGRVAYDRG
jgi:N-acetylglucosamine-6-phosphate deacetylase